MNKKLIILSLIIALTAVVTLGITTASAQNPTTSPFSNIVQKLARRFNLKEEEVKSVFDEVKLERHTQMQVKFEERLTQLVKDGKINESQKQAVIAKHKELQDKYKEKWENLKNLTAVERREALQKQRTDLETWAKSQGIDVNLLFGYGMHPKFGGIGRMHKW